MANHSRGWVAGLRRRGVVLVAAAATTTMGVACSSDEPPGPSVDPRLAEVRGELETFMAEHRFPGLSAAIVVDGKIASTLALGVRSTETGEALTVDDVVPTGSIAVKFLLGLELARMASDGVLDLDAPVVDVLPWLELPVQAHGTTFHDAMVMRSGLMSPLRTSCADPSLEAALAEVSSVTPPGDIWMYSSTGFTIAAAAVEALEGRRFEDVLAEHQLGPMGMPAATFDAAVAMSGSYAASHVMADGTTTAYEPDALPQCAGGEDCSRCEDFRANAGLFAGTLELAGLVEHALAGEAPFDGGILQTLDGRAAKMGWGEAYRYGYGLFSLDFGGHTLVMALTEYAGVTGVVAWIPGTGFGLVLLSNAMLAAPEFGIPHFQRAALSIARRFVELPTDEPDLTTPPRTWATYEGRYWAQLTPYDVTLTADGRLEITSPLWPGQEVVPMVQGSVWPWVGGDTFHFRDPEIGAERDVTFYVGAAPDGAMEYMFDHGWRGTPSLLARRTL